MLAQIAVGGPSQKKSKTHREEDDCIPLHWNRRVQWADQPRSRPTSPSLRACSLPTKGTFKQEYVYRNKHPLRTGLHGKLYCRFDYVTPLADTMRQLHEQIYGHSILLAIQTEQSKAMGVETLATTLFEPPSFLDPNRQCTPFSFQNHPDPDRYFSGEVNAHNRTDEEEQSINTPNHADVQVCVLCGNDEITGEWVLTDDKDTWVCSCGTPVGGMNMISMNREKNCEESEDKTTRADTVYNPRLTRFNKEAPTSEETRRIRVREQMHTHIPLRVAKKMGLEFQNQRMARKSATEARMAGHVTESNPFGWTPSEQSKADAVARELEKLITQYKPINEKIKEYLRSETARMWTRVVAHDRVCTAARKTKQCRLCLSERMSQALAEASFDYNLDRLMHRDAEILYISHEDVRDLKERVSADKKSANNKYKISTSAMVSRIMEDPTTAPCDTESSDSEASSASARISMLGKPVPPFQRSESSFSVSEPSLLMTLVQSVHRVHRLFALNCNIPNSVRDKAVDLLSEGKLIVQANQGRLFFSMQKHGGSNPLDGLEGSEAKVAYAILVALDDLRSINTLERARRGDTALVLQRIKVEPTEAEALVRACRDCLVDANLVISAPSPMEEEADGLF